MTEDTTQGNGETPPLKKACHLVDLGDYTEPPDYCKGMSDGCCCSECCTCGG